LSIESIEEETPGFTRRLGDQAIQGSNNTIIILGTDRAKKGPASIDDGLGSTKSPSKGKKAGSIHAIAGRNDKDGNPDLDKDSAYLYLSMNTDVDKHLGSDSIEGNAGNSAAAILKSDNIRIVGRKSLKIFLDGNKSYLTINKDNFVVNINGTKITIKQDGEVIIDSKKIKLGKDAGVGATLTDILVNKLNEALDLIKNHEHPTSAGPAGPSTTLSSLKRLDLQDVSSKRTFVDKG
jgi:hypothetical protein